MASEPQVPAWGVVLACVAAVLWLAAARALVTPRLRRRPRYVGAHSRRTA